MSQVEHFRVEYFRNLEPFPQPSLKVRKSEALSPKSSKMIPSNKEAKSLPNAFAGLILRILTFSYSGAYAYHTVKPIEQIEKHQQYLDGSHKYELISALAHFRRTKTNELEFVSKAAALSAAAVVGVFSWPATEKTVWIAKMLWNWSFFLSSFSLISSAHQRLLRHLPQKEDDLDYTEDSILVALNLFLQPPVGPESLSAKAGSRRVSKRMLWVWQCPTMLMSYSWVLFLVGYAMHVLTPVFDPSQAEVSSKIAIITVCGCALVVLNFIFCAGLCQFRLQKGARG